MLNPKTSVVLIDDTEYEIMWQDYGYFFRLNVFQNENRIGYRDLPVYTVRDFNTVRYLVRRMVGGYGPIGKDFEKQKEFTERIRKGTWLSCLRRVWSRSKDVLQDS